MTLAFNYNKYGITVSQLGDTNLISSNTGATDPEFLKLEIIILFLFPTDPNKKCLGKTFLFCNWNTFLWKSQSLSKVLFPFDKKYSYFI